jgi:hypothetical protein
MSHALAASHPRTETQCDKMRSTTSTGVSRPNAGVCQHPTIAWVAFETIAATAAMLIMLADLGMYIVCSTAGRLVVACTSRYAASVCLTFFRAVGASSKRC